MAPSLLHLTLMLVLLLLFPLALLLGALRLSALLTLLFPWASAIFLLFALPRLFLAEPQHRPLALACPSVEGPTALL